MRLAARLLLPVVVVAGTLASAALAAPAPSPAMDAIRQSGALACGVVAATDDYEAAQVHGDLSALGTDLCRALAIAVLGPDAKLQVASFPSEIAAAAALHAGAVQVVMGLSPSALLAAHDGLAFGPPVFWDTQRVMVAADSGIADLDGLRDRLVCTASLSEPERVLREAMDARGVPFGIQSHSEQGELDAAVAVRRCAAGTGMESRLAQSRAGFRSLARDFVFLPERLSLDPVVPAWRYGDQTFGLVIETAVRALVAAEALGVTQANVDALRRREDLPAGLLFGHDRSAAEALGLADDWTVPMLRAVGNYGEVFARDVAAPYHIERGPNALWTHGGLMAPWPIR